MTEREARRTLNGIIPNELKRLFFEHFNTNGLVIDLMDLVAWSKLRRFIVDQFLGEFKLDELEFMLKEAGIAIKTKGGWK